MKRILLLALCALFALNAEARTLYVDASRPNNSGNGLSARKAKKTIQAAVNAAKKGDTILVLPGTYSPIRTNNRKIAVKSTKGRAQTAIVRPKTKTFVALWGCPVALAEMGKAYKFRYIATSGPYRGKRRTVTRYKSGKASTVSGFTLDGRNWDAMTTGVHGGVLKCSRIVNLGDGSPNSRYSTITAGERARLFCCTIENNYIYSLGAFLYCKVNRCVIRYNRDVGSPGFAWKSSFTNSLIADNVFDGGSGDIGGCSFLNCTIAWNVLSLNATWKDNRYANCILRNNRDSSWDFLRRYKTGSFSNTYRNNPDPKFVDDVDEPYDYRLQKGSPCINKGRLTKKQKKLVGTKDLAGRKRIRGKAIDMGCYEY